MPTDQQARSPLPAWARRLDLVVVPCKGGHSYEWHDQHGHILCCGWHDGNRADTCRAAAAHLVAQPLQKAGAP